MHIGKMKESKYLAKHDVTNNVTPSIRAKIAGLDKANLAMENQPEEWKYILLLQGKNVDGDPLKPLVLNQENIQRIAMTVGSEETDDWIGKIITLYNDTTVAFGGKMVGGIRVHVAQPVDQQVPAGDPFDDDIEF
jgi:hypothetical protein